MTKRKAQNTAPELVDELDKIGKKSREMVQIMRDTIWSLNDESSQSVWERMYLIATEVLTANNIELKWKVPAEDTLPNLPFNTKRNLFLAFKEAVNNIVKHAEASLVRVEIRVINNEFHLWLTDNGKGFDAQNIDNQGNGLKNFKARMSEVAGTVILESTIGEGTTITFKLPFERDERA